MRQYIMREMCDDCPFMAKGKGLRLRKTLAKGRWQEITTGLLRGEHFFCHKTTHGPDSQEEDDAYTPGRADMICAGSVAFQAKHGIVADAIQVLSRLEQMERLVNKKKAGKEVGGGRTRR